LGGWIGCQGYDFRDLIDRPTRLIGVYCIRPVPANENAIGVPHELKIGGANSPQLHLGVVVHRVAVAQTRAGASPAPTVAG
jgi:hypothetical protein